MLNQVRGSESLQRTESPTDLYSDRGCKHRGPGNLRASTAKAELPSYFPVISLLFDVSTIYFQQHTDAGEERLCLKALAFSCGLSMLVLLSWSEEI